MESGVRLNSTFTPLKWNLTFHFSIFLDIYLLLNICLTTKSGDGSIILIEGATGRRLALFQISNY